MNFNIMTYAVFSILLAITQNAIANQKNEAGHLATSENLEFFELSAPELTPEEQSDYENGLKVEEDELYQQDLYEELSGRKVEDENISEELDETEEEVQDSKLDINWSAPGVRIEIYQQAPSIGKQFLVARKNGKIRFVFAISAADSTHVTPGGEFGVHPPQLWRHMSTKYPGRGENNMDHLTYFKPMYGFHATTFGAYQKLGRPDSHGCVRMGRPEARAVYRMIKAHGSEAKIVSYRFEKDPPQEEIPLIKKQLAKDFNLIQKMLSSHNKGDVPFDEKGYNSYRASGKKLNQNHPALKKMGIKEIIEIAPDQDLSQTS